MKTTVLETRREGHIVRRRRRAAEGVEFWTIEMPEKAASWLPKASKNTRERLAGFDRELKRLILKAKAQALIAEGIKPLAIAHMLNMDVKLVHDYSIQLRRRAR